MSFTPITVTGTFEREDGLPVSGLVRFQLTAPMQDGVGLRVAPVKIEVRLDSSGSFSQSLFATDDTTTAPTGVTYTVTETIDGAAQRVYSIVVSHTALAGTVDLAEIAPAVPTALAFDYALKSYVDGLLSTAGIDAKIAAQHTADNATYVAQAVEVVHVGLPSGDTSGATDSATIAALIAAIPAGASGVPGGVVVQLSKGAYYINATILFSLTYSPRLRGMGKRSTTIIPTTALAGLPVVQFTDCRDARVEDLWIQGTPSGSPASTAILSYRNGASGTVAGLNGHGLTVDSCLLGSDGGVQGIARGVQWLCSAADSTHDTNNDYGVLNNVEVFNFTVAAYDIGHFNSLQHHISGGMISGGPTFVRCAGGSFTAVGTRLGALTGYAFDFEVPFGVHNYYPHRCTAIGLMVESPSQVVTSKSGIGTTVGLWFSMIGCDWEQAPSGGATMFDWQAPSSIFEAAFSDFDFGQAACPANFTHSGSIARFTGCRLGVTTHNYNGRLILKDNFHVPGTVTLANSGSGVLDQIGDGGGGFTKDTTSRALTVGGTISGSSIGATGTAPTLAAVASNYGTGASNSMTAGSSDSAMEVNITSGSASFVAQAGQQVNFGGSHATAPKAIIVTPSGAGTAAGFATQQLGVPYITSKTSTNFVFRVPNAPVASQVYVWEIVAIF